MGGKMRRKGLTQKIIERNKNMKLGGEEKKREETKKKDDKE